MLNYDPNKTYSMNDITHIVMNHSRDEVFRYAMSRHIEVLPEQSIDEICQNFNKKFITKEWWTGALSSYRILYYLEDVYNNFDKYCNVYYSLGDQLSKKTMMHEMQYRIFADFKNLKPVEDIPEYFNKLLNFNKNEVYVDCGAYVGDTILSFIKYVNGYASKIYGYEAISDMYKKCIDNLQVENLIPDESIILRNYAVSDAEKFLTFGEINEGPAPGGYKSSTGSLSIPAISLDNDIKEAVSMIKMDIEGSEQEALIGSKRHIKNDCPKMAICVYHLPNDIWRIPEIIKSINSNYTFYLRRHYVIINSNKYALPFDLVLYCLPKVTQSTHTHTHQRNIIYTTKHCESISLNAFQYNPLLKAIKKVQQNINMK